MSKWMCDNNMTWSRSVALGLALLGAFALALWLGGAGVDRWLAGGR